MTSHPGEDRAPAKPARRRKDDGSRPSLAERRRQRKERPPLVQSLAARYPLRDVFLTARPFWATGGLVAAFVAAYFVPVLLPVVQVAALGLAVLLVADGLVLWASGGRVEGERAVPEKLSLGDENVIEVSLRSTYPVPITARVIDEVPVQFQERGDGAEVPLATRGAGAFAYTLRPTTRGAYAFGRLLVYASTPLGLVARRFVVASGGEAAVYPSIVQMRRFAFLADRNRLREIGVKRVRRRGHTMEFDQIREYVPGDDRRAVNWKATARRSVRGPRLMVNTYQDEREQPVVVALDMGRAMRSPFDGLTLLDHAINASLVVLNTALRTQDRAGLVAFDREVRTVVPPDRKRSQLGVLLDALYRLDPGFQDPSFEGLYAAIRARLRQRGLILLMTNIDTVAGLERQLPYLRRIARA
ncbi:MAG: DUF58 domain-containing protein, partial [Bacteroidota bacterium]